MTSEAGPGCPACERPMRCGAFVLCEREDDGKRVCRTVWGCPEGHVWWLWADRPEEPPEPCPDPGLMGEWARSEVTPAVRGVPGA